MAEAMVVVKIITIIFAIVVDVSCQYLNCSADAPSSSWELFISERVTTMPHE
jgi:hypothetical protein